MTKNIKQYNSIESRSSSKKITKYIVITIKVLPWETSYLFHKTVLHV